MKVERGTRRTLTALVSAVAALALSGSAHADSGSTNDVWSRLHRPLHAPAAPVRCPVTPPAAASTFPDAVRQDGARLYGQGPVYLQLSATRGSSVLDMRYSAPRNGLRGQKTPWLVRPSYHGPLLIRAWRPDAPGVTMLSIAGAQEPELRIPWGKLRGRSVAGGWRGFPSSTWVSGPGCRVWQIDGLTFSQTIVAHVRF